MANGMRTAASSNPDVVLDFAANNGEQFEFMMRHFGVFSPEGVLAAAVASKTGAKEADVEKLLAAAQNPAARFFEGGAYALKDQIDGITTLANMGAEVWKALAKTLDDNPMLIPESMVAPFKERIERGDYAGALGYAAPSAGEIAALAKAAIAGGKAVVKTIGDYRIEVDPNTLSSGGLGGVKVVRKSSDSVDAPYAPLEIRSQLEARYGAKNAFAGTDAAHIKMDRTTNIFEKLRITLTPVLTIPASRFETHHHFYFGRLFCSYNSGQTTIRLTMKLLVAS